MDKIIIAGISGHSKVIIDIVEKQQKYELVGLTDKTAPRGTDVLGYPVLGTDEDLSEIVRQFGVVGGIVGVGDNWLRSRIAEKIKEIRPEFRFVTAIHPSAQIAKGTTLGEGTVVMAGVTVNSCCTIGRFCILNTQASLDHDSEMNDFSSIAPGVTAGGNVRIGAFSAVGIGATLIHGVEIGEHAVIGANAGVLKNIASHKVAYGTPAKVVRDREVGERYF